MSVSLYIINIEVLTLVRSMSWYHQSNPIWRIPAWRAWRLPRRWPDGGLSEGYGHGGPGVCLGDGQKSTVAGWTRRRAAPAYALIPGLCDVMRPLMIWKEVIINIILSTIIQGSQMESDYEQSWLLRLRFQQVQTRTYPISDFRLPITHERNRKWTISTF